jgi:hypothetical protein
VNARFVATFARASIRVLHVDPQSLFDRLSFVFPYSGPPTVRDHAATAGSSRQRLRRQMQGVVVWCGVVLHVLLLIVIAVHIQAT